MPVDSVVLGLGALVKARMPRSHANPYPLGRENAANREACREIDAGASWHAKLDE